MGGNGRRPKAETLTQALQILGGDGAVMQSELRQGIAFDAGIGPADVEDLSVADALLALHLIRGAASRCIRCATLWPFACVHYFLGIKPLVVLGAAHAHVAASFRDLTAPRR